MHFITNYNTLKYFTTPYETIQHFMSRYNTLWVVTTHYESLQHFMSRYNTLWVVTTFYESLQHYWITHTNNALIVSSPKWQLNEERNVSKRRIYNEKFLFVNDFLKQMKRSLAWRNLLTQKKLYSFNIPWIVLSAAYYR